MLWHEALGVQPVPAIVHGAEHALDAGSPMVKRHIAQACVAIVRNFEDARQPRGAEASRNVARTRHHVPAEVFANDVKR